VPLPRARYVIVGHCCESGDLLSPAPGEPETIDERELEARALLHLRACVLMPRLWNTLYDAACSVSLFLCVRGVQVAEIGDLCVVEGRCAALQQAHTRGALQRFVTHRS
jgi:hypothetical protein